MPTERRSTRSNKSDTTGERAPADAQKSTNSTKDKPSHKRTASNKSKSSLSASKAAAAKTMSGDKGRPNGDKPTENGANGVEDVEMADDSVTGKPKGKDGDEEMTVVVPPTKGPKLAGDSAPEGTEDVAMEGVETSADKTDADAVDPQAKAVAGTCARARLISNGLKRMDELLLT